MSERDYGNAYDDWLRDGGLEGTGQQLEEPQYPQPSGAPAPQTPWWGADYRDPWLDEELARQKAAVSAPPQTYGGGYSGGQQNPFTFDGGGRPGGYGFPSFNPPGFSHGDYQAANPFVFEKFSAPTLEEAQNEPGYAFSKREGEQGLMNNRSAMGTLRSSGTLKDLLKWYNGFAEQNYGNVFNRSLGTFRENEGNRFNAFNANEGNRFQGWNANKDLALNTFDRTYKGAYDKFQGDVDTKKFELGDEYNRWAAKLNSATQLAMPPG